MRLKNLKVKNIVALLGVIIFVWGLWSLHSYKTEKSNFNSRFYLQGLGFVNKKDYQNAYYNFSSVSRGNEFYCPSKYRAALAAQNLYDKDSAILMYKEVVKKCGGTIFDETSKYNLAKLLYEKKNYKRSRALFDMLAKSAETDKYRIASNYFLGEIDSDKKPKKALAEYLKYLEEVPDGKFASSAVLGAEKTKLPLGAEEHYILGAALYKNGDYLRAKAHLVNVPMGKSWYYLAMTSRKLGESKQALTFLDSGLRAYSKNVSEEDLQNAIDVYALYSADKKTGYFNAANILSSRNMPGGDYALYMYSEELPAKDRLPVYYRISEKYSNGKYASAALWHIIYSQYKKGNYKKVLELSDEHNLKYSHTIVAPRVLFFAGKAASKSGQFLKAKGYFSKIIANYPDDYYAFRAKLLLDGKNTAWTFKNKRAINKRNQKINFPVHYCQISSKDKSVVNLLDNVKDYKLLEDLFGDNEVIKSWVNYEAGNRSTSSVQARNFIEKLDVKPSFSDSVYKLAYPLYFVDEINKYAKDFDLDPYIVISIMKEESHFVNDAKSYVGAGGLMQVMPDTARFIADKYDFDYNSGSHNNVNSNIKLGCAYLDYSLSQTSKKYLFAVAGYNGGHNAVNRWRDKLNYNDFDEFVEEIPYKETQTYIRKVFKSYWNYLNIYDKIN